MARADYPWAGRRRKRVILDGLPIDVLEQERGIGRRHHVHSYPNVDLPFTEDLGRAPRDYRLEAVVIGDDYDRELLRLERVLERRGRKRLDLWYGDPVWVVVRAARIVERSAEQGFAVVSIDLVEAGQSASPSSRAGRSLVLRSLDALKAAANSAFPAVTSNVSTIASLGDAMNDLGQSLQVALGEALSFIDENSGDATDAATSLVDFSGRLDSLATDATSLALAVSGVIDDLVAIPSDPTTKFRVISDLMGWGASLVPASTSTPTGQLAAANQDALADLVSRLGAGQLAAITTQIEFDSSQAAAEHRQSLADQLDAVLLRAADAGETDVYSQLRAAKAIVVADLDSRAARLPVRVEVTLLSDLPSIVLGWRLYADPTRGPELATRNGVRHPAFMPGRTPLEVLSEGSSG